MPRTKGSKNRPKTNITKDYATQIAEKQETIASLTTEIASITANIDTLKAGYGAGLSVVMFLILTVLAVIMLKINGKEE